MPVRKTLNGQPLASIAIAGQICMAEEHHVLALRILLSKGGAEAALQRSPPRQPPPSACAT